MRKTDKKLRGKKWKGLRESESEKEMKLKGERQPKVKKTQNREEL